MPETGKEKAAAQLDPAEQSSVARRKPAKQQRARLTVQHILQTTMAMLDEGPADHISTNEIARRAGISIGTLYQYFPKKEAIYYELYRTWLSDTLAMMDEVDARFDGSEELSAYADAIFDQLSSEEGLNSPGHWQLRFTLGSTREVIALDTAHNQAVLARIDASQKKFSRALSPEKLKILAPLRHSVAVACLSAVANVHTAEERREMIHYCKQTLRHVYTMT